MSNPSEQGESGEDQGEKAAEKDGTMQSEASVIPCLSQALDDRIGMAFY